MILLSRPFTIFISLLQMHSKSFIFSHFETQRILQSLPPAHLIHFKDDLFGATSESHLLWKQLGALFPRRSIKLTLHEAGIHISTSVQSVFRCALSSKRMVTVTWEWHCVLPSGDVIHCAGHCSAGHLVRWQRAQLLNTQVLARDKRDQVFQNKLS